MNIFKSIILFSSIIVFLGSCTTKKSELISPNNKIKVFVDIEKAEHFDYGEAYFSVSYSEDKVEKAVLKKVKLGLETDAQVLSGNLKLVSASKLKFISDNYTMITGKKSHCTNQANERTFRFENTAGQILDVTFRAYNDGVVFCYEINSQADNENIIAEHTVYVIEDGIKRWVQPYEPSYEDFYPLATDGKYEFEPRWNRKQNMWAYPALFEPQDSLFLLLTEANIARGHCASRLQNADKENEYQIDLADEKLSFESSWKSPWRVMIIGSLADLVESTLVSDVSAPSKLKKTDWIVPGPASWIYWAYNYGSNNFQIVKDYIDLAAEMNWPYNLIDWKWDEMAHGGNVEDALSYSHKKGVKPILWYNSSTSWIGEGAPGPLYTLNEKENRIKEYARLKELGVAGIKIDFFNGDGSDAMNYYIDLLEDAAEYELMLNFHGATIPRGWQRTYPHMMTVEGVYGAEWYNNLPVLTNRAAEHNATLPFTRNIIGPMDYTPGTFSDSQHPHITSHGHELALYVVFESALQHMPDRPSSYRSLPDPVKHFLSTLPTAWDETKLLAGYPGTEVVIARRKGDVWYVGGLNGTNEPKTLCFATDFLSDSDKNLTLFKDGKEERSFSIEENLNIPDGKGKIEVKSLPRGGFVAVIK